MIVAVILLLCSLVCEAFGDPLGWYSQHQLLFSGQNETKARFGYLLAVGNGWIVSKSEKGPFGGSVFVFKWSKLTQEYEFAKELHPPQEIVTGNPIDMLWGEGLAVSGDMIAVSAPGSRKVCLFSGKNQDQVECPIDEPVVPGGRTLKDFGKSLGMDGDVLLVRAHYTDSKENTAFVYERDPQTGKWSQAVQLYPTDPDEFASFGGCLSIKGDLIVVPATRSSHPDSPPGSVFVFERKKPLRWVVVAKLVASDAVSKDQFGTCTGIDIASDGKATVIVGARERDAKRGAAYIFERPNKDSPFVEVASLRAFVRNVQDIFGYSVALRGEVALVSAAKTDEISKDSGSVFVYRRVNGTWYYDTTLFPFNDDCPDESAGFQCFDRFGIEVRVDDGERLVIGSDFSSGKNKLAQEGTISIFLTESVNTTSLFNGDADIHRIPAPTPTPSPTWAIIPPSDVNMTIDCDALNRVDNAEMGECGACRPFYSSAYSSGGSGKCHYLDQKLVADDSYDLAFFNVSRPPGTLLSTDLDQDGDIDFLFAYQNERILYIRNQGNATHPRFQVVSSPFLAVEDSFTQHIGGDLFQIDVNNDGIDEIVFGRWEDEIHTMINVNGDNHNPLYRLAAPSENPFSRFSFGVQSDPSFTCVDLKGKGYMDCFVGERQGTIHLLKNLGNGTFVLAPEENPFRDVSIGKESHPYLHFFDFDNDGDEDLFISDEHTNVYLYRNDWPFVVDELGTPKFTKVPTELNPFRDVDLKGVVRLSLAFVDLYNTSEYVAITNGVEASQMRFFKFDGGVGTPKFSLLLESANPMHNVRVSSLSNPHSVDLYRGDGAVEEELYIGDEYGRINMFTRDRTGSYVVNETHNPFTNFSMEFSANVCCEDLDGDGDFDCFLGMNNGSVLFLENIGNVQVPSFVGKPHPVTTLHVSGLASNIALGDVDGDGDIDVIVGDQSGSIFIYENFDETSFRLSQVLSIPDLFSNVALVALDPKPSLPFLFSGSKSGTIYHFKNLGNATFETKPEETHLLSDVQFHNQMSSIAFVDLDLDGDEDLVVGDVYGGLQTVKNTARECSAGCLGRGFCADSFDPTEDSMKTVAGLYGRPYNGEIAGMCWCEAGFQGFTCQQCIPTLYGVDCDKECPQYSMVPSEIGRNKEYPLGPVLDDCKCEATFERVNNTSGEGFECLCPPGAGYSPELKICQPCESGSFKEGYSLSQCTACSDFYGDSKLTTTGSKASNRSDCTCVGTFTLAQDSETARCVCQADYYMDFSGKFCNKCPSDLPFTMSVDALSESECRTGSNSFALLGQDNKIVSASCDAKEFRGMVDCDAKGLTLETLPLKPGFWRISPRSVDIRPCVSSEFCVPSENSSKSDPYCTPNHTGIMCNSCVEGFGISGSSTCVECSEDQMRRDRGLSITAIVIVVLVLVAPSLWLFMKREEQPSQDTKTRQSTLKHFRIAAYRSSREYDLGVKVRILVGFFQVFLIFGRAMGSFALGDNAIITSVLNFDLDAFIMAFRVGCMFDPNALQRLLLYTIPPLCCVIAMVCVVVGRKFIHVVLSNFIWMLIQICLLVYPGVSSAILLSFQMEVFPQFKNDPDPIEVLEVDYELPYTSAEARNVRIVAGFMSVVYIVGIPALFGGLAYLGIHAKKYNLEKHPKRKACIDGSMETLMMSYHKPYFECYELFRKVMLTSAFLLIYNMTTGFTAVIAFIILNATSLFILIKLNPYRDTYSYAFAEVSLILLFFLGFTGLEEHVDGKLGNPTSKGFTVFVGITEIVLFGAIIAFQVWLKKKKRNDVEQQDEDDSDSEAQDPVESPSSSFTEVAKPVLIIDDTQLEEEDISNCKHHTGSELELG